MDPMSGSELGLETAGKGFHFSHDEQIEIIP